MTTTTFHFGLRLPLNNGNDFAIRMEPPSLQMGFPFCNYPDKLNVPSLRLLLQVFEEEYFYQKLQYLKGTSITIQKKLFSA
jgi:hypothetical protein